MIGNHEEDEFVAVRVQDPRIQNEGSWNSYVDYKIFLHTNSKAFTAKTSCVRRRFSEFVWLKKKLQKNAGLVPVPDLPGKSFFSFSNENFLERRRKGLQVFLEKVVNTTVCLSDSQLHLFLQTQLPVGHIQDCVQGHTPYSVTDAILTYATSNRGLVQAQDDDSIKEPSLTVSYESMESPAPHQPCLETNQPCSPELHSGCDLGPVDGVVELHDNSKAHEKSSVRISERKNHLEAIVECVCGPSATFFLGDEQDDEESLVPAGETPQTSRQVQTPVDVHSPMGRGFSEDGVFKECAEREEDDNVVTSDPQVRTDPAAQSELEKTDGLNICEDANTDVLHLNDCKEQFIERDVRSHEEGLASESQVLENHIMSGVNGVELVDVECLKEPEVQQTREEEADKSPEDGRSLLSSNDSIVKLSDEESVCDDTDDSTQADPEEATHWPAAETTSRHILNLQMKDAASPNAEDLQSMTPVDGGDLTESSDFSVLESSCVPGLTGDKRTESDSLLSLDAAESPLRCPETRCIS